jgi:peptidylprolyl isomerase
MNKWISLSIVGMLAGVALLQAETPATRPAGEKRVTASGLTIVDYGGGGGGCKTGDRVWVHYTGKLTNGTKFDSSLDRAEPLEFTLGRGDVIKGWDEGIEGMQVGDKRQLTIPPNLGYGEQGNGPIPGNATLIFDVQLMGFRRPG